MKKVFRNLAVSLGVMFAPLVSSCSMFFGDDTVSISNVTVRTDDNGDKIVTIEYTEGTPLVFKVEKGNPGEDGVTISNIDYEIKDNVLTLKIYMSDDPTNPILVPVPVVKGEAGKGIEGINVNEDDDGNKTVTFVYSDGTESEPILVPKGKDGVGIKSVDVNTEDPYLTVVTISYTDETWDDTVIQIAQGQNGNGILYAQVSEDQYLDGYLLIDVIFDNGDYEQWQIPLPRATQWLRGESSPSENEGEVGDYYINVVNGNVYRKINESGNDAWQYLFCMKGTGSSVTYFVTFNLEGGQIEREGASPITGSFTREVEYGKYISNLASPTKEGYTFGGWWTSADIADPNAGHFTTLTPVFSDLNLYAHWLSN